MWFRACKNIVCRSNDARSLAEFLSGQGKRPRETRDEPPETVRFGKPGSPRAVYSDVTYSDVYTVKFR